MEKTITNLSKETVIEWLNIGYYAPSGDNIQPWIITIPDERTVVLALDPSLKHVFDKTKNSSLLSLGCFFECLNQSSEHFGIKIISNIFKDKSLTLTIAPQSKTNSAITILKIKSRVTDRSYYDKINDISYLNSILSKEENVMLYQNVPESIISKWLEFDYYIWKNTKLMKDFLKWMRLTYSKNTHVGISAHSLGMNFGEIIGLCILRMISFLGFSLKPFISKPLITKKIEDLITNSSGFVIFWESKLDDDVILNLGRKIQRVWMELNYLNISVHPMTIQSLVVSELSYYQNFLRNDFSDEAFRLASETLQCMQILKDSPSISYPIFILRVGKTKKAVESHGRKFFKADL